MTTEFKEMLMFIGKFSLASIAGGVLVSAIIWYL